MEHAKNKKCGVVSIIHKLHLHVFLKINARFQQRGNRIRLKSVVRLSLLFWYTKYSFTNGKLNWKKRPSLLEKVDFIKRNKDKYDLPNYNVKGLVLTRLYPFIDEYKGIIFKSYEEIIDL